MVITDVNQVVYQGDGSNTAWPFTFRIVDATDVKLMLIDADGTETDITSDYFVDTVNNTVHYPGYAPGAEPPEAEQPAPVQTGQRLVIYRELPITQEKDLGDKWPFFVIELALDKLTMILQQIYGWWGRTLKFPVGWEIDHPDFDTSIPIEAGKTWRVNDEGTGFIPSVPSEDAMDVAQEAKDIANAASDTADGAVAIANDAKNTAEGIAGTAQNALDVANAASNTADAASDTAADAKSTAEGIAATAQEALDTVNALVDDVIVKDDVKVVDVLLNGAKGDGVTDDTTVIQGLINTNPHSIIYFPKGTYLISSTITTPADTPNKVFLKFEDDATLYASDGFIGTWLIELGGTGTPDTSGDTSVTRGNRWFTGITGGRLNCRYKCSGIHYTGISLGYIADVHILCAKSIGIQIEPKTQSYSSSDAYLHNIWADGPQCSPGSKGIVVNGTDNDIDYVRVYAFEIGIELNGQTNHLTHCHPLYSDLNASAVHNNSVGYKVNSSKQFLDDCYSDNFATSIYITGNYPVFCNNFNQYVFTSGSSYTHTFCKNDGTLFCSAFVNTCLNYTANGTTNYGYVGPLDVKPYSGAGIFGLNIFDGINRLTLGKADKIFDPAIYKDQSNLNPLFQKTILFTGDSICQGYGDQDNLGGYVGRVGRDNVVTVYNYGVGGAKITEISGQACICTTIDTMYAEHPNADYVIMEGGINDADWLGTASTAAQFGTFDETDFSGTYDKTTFCGAVEHMFYKASTLFPKAKFGFVVVCKCPYGNSTGYQSFINNYRAYFDVVAALCEKWGVSCLDLWNTSSANPRLLPYYDPSKTVAQNQAADKFYIDGKHPAARGYTYMAQRIGQWMQTMSESGAGYLPTRGGVMRNSIAGNLSVPFIRNSVTNGSVKIAGGKTANNGSYIWLYGKDHSSEPGYFDIDAQDGSNLTRLRGTPSGKLTWGGKGLPSAFLGNVSGAVAKTLTLPSSGTYLVVVGHNSTPSYNGLFIVRTDGNSAFKIAGAENVTMTCSGTSITVTSAGGITVSYIWIATS